MRKSPAPKRHLPTSPFLAPTAPTSKQFTVGSRVTHDVYGLGRVTAVEEGVAVVVDFGSLEARIMSPYNKLSNL
ncbi:hypothetical protein ACFYO2_07020 [Streptomyces sp. NPDC006602]|uniref:hypothetical protein n=1 Tax=Streptomyces sp. NPDC006602 TaxID=3364751 RepID=UPI0036C4BC2D